MHIREILNEAFEDDIDGIRAYLHREYWRPAFETTKFEIWKHMDDPSIGEYRLELTPDRKHITRVTYIHPMSTIFNRVFDDTDTFLDHVTKITDDPIDPKEMEAGIAKLKSIADQLRADKAKGIVRYAVQESKSEDGPFTNIAIYITKREAYAAIDRLPDGIYRVVPV